MLVTFLLLTAVTLSLLAIKLVYLDALCLSSGYQEASVLFCHPTERVAKTNNNCHIFDQSLPISSKMHNLLYSLHNLLWPVQHLLKKCSQHNQEFPGLFARNFHGYWDGLFLPQTMTTSRAKGKKRQQSKL